MIVNVTIVAPEIVVCGFGIVVTTIEGCSPLVMIGLPAGMTTTEVSPGGTVTVLGPITVVEVSGPAVTVCMIIEGLELAGIVTTMLLDPELGETSTTLAYSLAGIVTICVEPAGTVIVLPV